MTPDQAIIHSMRLLKNAEPEAYEMFARALDAKVYELVTATVSAPASDILVAQGRAQAGQKFFQLLVTDIPK